MADYEKIKLKNGKTRYRKYVSLGVVNGKRKSTRITADTLKELKKKEAELLLKKKKVISQGFKTFIEVYDLYLADQKKTLAATTMDQKRWAKSIFKIFFDIPLNKIDDVSIENFIEARSKQVGAETVRHEYTMLKAFFVWTFKKKIIESNPFDYLSPPKVEPKEMKYIKEEEFWKIYNVIKEPRYKVLFMTLFFCGLRKGEVCGLSDGDLVGNELHLHRTVKDTKENGLIISSKFKTPTSRRIVPIPRFLKYDLQYYLNKDKYPFKNDYRNLSQILKLILKDADVKRIRVHDFRHSYAALLISKGVDIYTISKLMGHSSVATTSRVYGHLYDEKRKEITDLF